MTRRDLLRILLASAIAEAVDVEQLFWTLRAIVTVAARITTYASIEEFGAEGYVLGVLKQGSFAFNVNWVYEGGGMLLLMGEAK